jgi:tRNA-splicing ligase RtcB
MNRPSNLRVWSDRPPPTEVQQALTRLARAEDVVSVAAMPDVHLAKDVCIGTVVATEGTLYPAAVGGDIGCGMAAMAFDGSAEVLDRESRARELLGSLRRAVPIIRHSDGGAPMGPLLEDSRLVGSGLERKRSGLAREQLGTLGRGNHFLELQADEHDQLWLMVHSGSRPEMGYPIVFFVRAVFVRPGWLVYTAGASFEADRGAGVATIRLVVEDG